MNYRSWTESYLLAKNYYLKHGNLLIPHGYIVKDAKGNDIKIGVWIHTQRNFYKKKILDKDKISLLNDINMSWDVRDDAWNNNYQLAKEYYLKHGNLLIPYNYSVKDINGNTIELGTWLNVQRRKKKKNELSNNQISLLEDIKIEWELMPNKWMKNYVLAKEYYLKHGNLLIPHRYKVVLNDKKIVNLGYWINSQRKAYKGQNGKQISDEQIKLLEGINMKWDNLNNEIKYTDYNIKKDKNI